MKRTALALTALAALTAFTGCSSDEEPATTASASESTETDTETEEATEAAPEDESTFQDTYNEVNTLFAVLNTQEDVSPTSTEEANAAAGLDDTTPLVFVDYTVLPEDETSGSFCLYSATNDDYVAVTYSGPAGEVDLGEGDCSYETTDADVVGDLATDTWTTGGELMGDLVPSAVFGG